MESVVAADPEALRDTSELNEDVPAESIVVHAGAATSAADISQLLANENVHWEPVKVSIVVPRVVDGAFIPPYVRINGELQEVEYIKRADGCQLTNVEEVVDSYCQEKMEECIRSLREQAVSSSNCPTP